ncbi:MAG: PEP-CTERM sorting domain-containing protein [Luteolibacter sp.]
MKPTYILPAALLFASLALPSAHAALISYDSFTGYTAGELPDNPAPAVTGYTGNWTATNFGTQQQSVTVGSLTYADALYAGSTGDKVTVPNNVTGGEITSSNSGRTYRALDSTLAVTSSTAGSLYLSFLFQSGQETGATTYQTLHLNQGTDGDVNRAFDLGITTNSGSGLQYNFGVNGAYTSTGVAADTTVRLFVVKFDLSSAASSDSVTVWTNPTLGGVGDPTGGVTVSGTNLVWSSLMFSDYDGNSAAWDEIRWGTDFNSVTIPEPGAVLLGGIGVLSLLRRRRA